MQTTVVDTRRERLPLNGVDTPTLVATINAVKGMPELALTHGVPVEVAVEA
jgi:hypothetical protein